MNDILEVLFNEFLIVPISVVEVTICFTMKTKNPDGLHQDFLDSIRD